MADTTTPQQPYDIDTDRQGSAAAASYNPTDKDLATIALINARYEEAARRRRPHEQQWFINASFWRGQQYVEWNNTLGVPLTAPAPVNRVRLTVNKIFPKIRARQAKFLKSRPKPTVRPFNNDIESREDARVTEQALDYYWRKGQLEEGYQDALDWASKTGHGHWWFSWDPTALGRVRVQDEMGQTQIEEARLGDVSVEADGCYSLLVGDPSQARIGRQPWIMRTKIRSLEYIQARFTEKGKYVTAESIAAITGQRYEKQLSLLSPAGVAGVGASDQVDTKGSPDSSTQTALVKELFTAPCGPWPKGRYQVVSSNVLLKSEDALPFDFWDMPANPYPVVDFPDIGQVGQYWITTVLEQLIVPQREYNLIRSKVAEQLRLQAFPKLLVAVQHRIPISAWTSAPGEMIPYVAQPNIPPPQPLPPGNIAQDAWRSLELLDKEMQDITQIFPEAEGRVGSSTSGFLTNLLQEASDTVHAPDIRAHERAIEEAAIKIRRIMKQGYTIPRLLSIAGRDSAPEVFEFGQEDIDEHAEIVVEAGSGLPMLKAARIQSILELFKSGLLGNQMDPEVQRRALMKLEMGTTEDVFRDARMDDEEAMLENKAFRDGAAVRPPEFFQNHNIHYKGHTSQLKSPDASTWPDEKRLNLIAHIILHVKFQNPQSAILLAQQYGLTQLVADIMPPAGSPEGQAPPPGTPTPGAPSQGPAPGGTPPAQGMAHLSTAPGAAPMPQGPPAL